MTKSRAKAVLLILAMLSFGFFQEKLKIGTNYILEHAPVIENYNQQSPAEREQSITQIKAEENISYDYYYSHESMGWLFQFSTGSLSALKWALSLLFVLVHFLAVWLILQWWFGPEISLKQLMVVYLLVLSLAFGVFILGRLMGFSVQGYAFARELLGGLQSLVPLMLLAPAIWLQRNFKAGND